MTPEYLAALKQIASADETLRSEKIAACATEFGIADGEVRAEIEKIIEALKKVAGSNRDGNGHDRYEEDFLRLAKMPQSMRSGKRIDIFVKNHEGVDHATVMRQLEEYDLKQRKVALICAKDIKPEPIDWLWKGWLARGKLEILAGTKGDGKSTIGFSISAIASRGGEWPDGTSAKEGKVLIWSGEDGKADTIVPRLIAMSAKLENIHIISTVTEGNGERRYFDPSMDLGALESAIAEIDGAIDLLILDPFVSAVKRGKNSHNNAETRQGLQHVVEFAEKHNCAVLGIHHLTKGTAGQAPLDRVTGSLAFTALSRIVLMTVKRKEDDGVDPPRMLVRAASNIGPNSGGFAYNTELVILQEPPIEASQVKWFGAVDGEAHELIAEAEEVKDKSAAVYRAFIFLKETLKDGSMRQTELMERAKEEGHSEMTIRRAKKEIGIKPRKEGASGHWVWELPAAQRGM